MVDNAVRRILTGRMSVPATCQRFSMQLTDTVDVGFCASRVASLEYCGKCTSRRVMGGGEIDFGTRQ